MAALPSDLVSAIELRIADPVRRHDDFGGIPGEVLTEPEQVFALFEKNNPELGRTPFRDVVAQMNAWGQKMPPMHVTRYADGGIGTSSTDELAQPLARPATEEDVAKVEAMIGRKLPADLRALYAIADGGWGPGTAYTSDLGTGFQSLSAVASTLADLRRRGPGWTGEAPWPDHLLPIADTTGPVSYNLDTGEIVAFNDYWYNDDLTIDQAFSVTHPTLEAWLREWVAS
jgi:hypothetical protein